MSTVSNTISAQNEFHSKLNYLPVHVVCVRHGRGECAEAKLPRQLDEKSEQNKTDDIGITFGAKNYCSGAARLFSGRFILGSAIMNSERRPDTRSVHPGDGGRRYIAA